MKLDNVPNNGRTMRGQPALEYLVTYGWAILIIAIAVVLIVYFIVLPSFVPPPSCNLTGPLHCADLIVSSNPTNTIFTIFLLNQQDVAVNNAIFFVNLNGTNSSSVTCLPTFIKSGANAICRLTLNQVTRTDQAFSGSLYVKVGNCALVTNYTFTGNCIGAPNVTSGGSFTTRSGGTTTFSTTVSVASTTVATTTVNGPVTSTLPAALSVSGVSASPPTFTLAGTSTLSASASGGQPPYTYQWFEQAPGGSWVNVGSGSSYSFPTTRWSTLGTYGFIMQAKDSASSIANSAEGYVTVQAPSVPILLTNNQGSATQSPFQQLLIVPASSYPANIDASFNNIEFSTAPDLGGTVLNAWIENSPVNTSAGTAVWVKLSSAIAADSAMHIYMNFMPGGVLSNVGPTGEAAELSDPSYGLYDDGNVVFTFYDFFPGTSLNSVLWATYTSGAVTTFSNGIKLATGGGVPNADAILWRTGYATSTPIIAEANIISYPGTDPGDMAVVSVSNELSYSYGSTQNGAMLSSNPCDGSYPNLGVTAVAGPWQSGTSFLCGNTGWEWASPVMPAVSSPITPFIAGISWVNASALSTFMNDSLYNILTPCTSGSCSGSNELITGYFPPFFSSATSIYPAFGYFENSGGSSGYMYIQWARGRALPPNSIMPSVSFNH